MERLENKEENEPLRKNKCPFFLERRKLICDAGVIPYTPSFFKIEHYCKTGNYRECIIYTLESN